jgi:hypothetical protein
MPESDDDKSDDDMNPANKGKELEYLLTQNPSLSFFLEQPMKDSKANEQFQP